MFKTPVWYVTPQEFADLVVEVMIEQKYFAEDDMCHPEDLAYCLATVAESIAKGMGYAGRRVFEAEKMKAATSKEYLDSLKEKAAMMTPKNLKKVLPDDPEYPVS